MNYGIEDNKFYIDIKSCDRKPGNMREESEHRARELASKSDKLLLSLSSGVDSQSIVHSFQQIGATIDTVFMYLPGYNDYEYENLQIVAKKFNIKPMIIDFDPYKIKDDLIQESAETGIHVYSILWKHFLTLIPEDRDFLQMTHDPYVHWPEADVPDKEFCFYMGYNMPEIHRDRAFRLVDRSGELYYYGDTPEFLLSIIDDPIFRAALKAFPYIKDNGVVKDGADLMRADRWDYYIKPFMYGKYWKDELLYFPKYVGFEKLDFFNIIDGSYFKQSILVNYERFIKLLKSPPGNSFRFYEQVRLK
jgi:hypothetical protein